MKLKSCIDNENIMEFVSICKGENVAQNYLTHTCKIGVNEFNQLSIIQYLIVVNKPMFLLKFLGMGYDADLCSEQTKNITALNMALELKHYDLIDILLFHGANIDALYCGKTAFEHALLTKDEVLYSKFLPFINKVENIEDIKNICIKLKLDYVLNFIKGNYKKDKAKDEGTRIQKIRNEYLYK